jgi:hypothetical protein
MLEGVHRAVLRPLSWLFASPLVVSPLLVSLLVDVGVDIDVVEFIDFVV